MEICDESSEIYSSTSGEENVHYDNEEAAWVQNNTLKNELWNKVKEPVFR